MHPRSDIDTPADSESDIVISGAVEDDAEVLKVSAHSRPSAVAGAIAGVIRSHGRADVQAIGAGATNQAIKAVAIARDYLQPNGIDIVVVPAFIDVMIADEERTAIRLVVEARQ
jgi:stage V sporulation protein S